MGFIFFAILVAVWAIVASVVAVFVVALAPVIEGILFFPWVFPFGIFLALNVGLTVWSWTTLKDIDTGRYSQAQTASLILGILGLFANIISGIFFLLAYSKLGSAIAYARVPPPSYQPAASPAAGRICVECGRPIAMDAKFCQHCGKELA